jgi:DNA-binding transcriptional LysR family regulator
MHGVLVQTIAVRRRGPYGRSVELELRHLRTVRAIADAGSLTKAALALGLAQPALSTQLQRLERALGGPLFERDRTGARLTALGEVVVERARVVLPAVQNLQEEVLRLASATAGLSRLRIGCTHGPVVGALVGRLADVLPRTPVAVHTSWSISEMAQLTLSGQLDYVLAGVCGQAPPPAAEQLVWHTIGVDPIFVMLSEDHPLAALDELPLRALAGERWTSVPGDGCFGDCFAVACCRAGFSPSKVLESDVSSIVHLVEVGRAVGLCRATFPPTPGIVTRPLAGSPLSWRHVFGWHPGGPTAQAARIVADWAREGYTDAVRRNAGYAHWLTGHPEFGPDSGPVEQSRVAPAGAS